MHRGGVPCAHAGELGVDEVCLGSSVRRHPKSCRICSRGEADGVHVSATGLCPEHGEARYLANHRQLQAHSGPFFDWWRFRSLAALGDLRELLDTAPPASDTGD